MAAVLTKNMTFPFPLGFIVPGAGFAAASVPVTQNLLPDRLTFAGVLFQADSGNVLDIYICSTAAAPDVAAGLNIIARLAPGQILPYNREWGNQWNLANFFVGALNATDKCIVNVTEV